MSEYFSEDFVLTLDNILGDFAGNTFGADALEEEIGPIIDLSAVLEDPNNPDPPDYDGPVRAKTDKQGNILYPIDSEFGYEVTDFEGAIQKVRNAIYGEGWVGTLYDGGTPIGITISNAETDTFQAGAPLGTWAAGLGGNAVKASTEHYVVMQNVLSDQAFPGDSEAVFALDNDLMFMGGLYNGMKISEVNPEAKNLNAAWYEVVSTGLAPNENSITENIAFGNDYSITKKDDGKLLYRWGQMVKRPNDIRIALSMDLPEEWTNSLLVPFLTKGFKVNKAYLVVDHTITNNPNDQIRPEDYENEAATGRLPSYEINNNGTPDNPDDDIWLSLRDSFTGDGTFLPKGTIFKDPGLIIAGGASDDLANGFTNAWYTSTDRDPFEWSVDRDPDPWVQDYIGFRSPQEILDAGYSMEDVVSGPRWRLTANKFGQDLPGVEIPAIPNSEPPFTKDNIKYEVGEATTTVLNLLDWEVGEESPLLYSHGWTQADPEEVDENGVTENGLKLTEKFDVAFYFKGDVKAADIYDARLEIDYQDIDPVFDMIWRNPSAGENNAWFIESGEQLGSAPLLLDPGSLWMIEGIGDFDADGDRDDLFWRHSTTGKNSIWFTDLTETGVAAVGGGFLLSVPGTSWHVGGVGDFDGDGHQDDPIWFNAESDRVAVWFLEDGQPDGSGSTWLDFKFFVEEDGWEIVGVGSFDGEAAVDDVVWRNILTGENAISIMNGTSLVETLAIHQVASPDWQIFGVADFEGDGVIDDLGWRHVGRNITNLWFMDGTTLIGGVADLQPAQTAEFVPIA